ncbi:MAG: sulfatase-like hydrolase/transferase [Bacteroidota bacterium]
MVLFCIAGCSGGEEFGDAAPVQPNIILIMADDLGYETLGVNGSTAYSTPNLDQLAETGMRFTAAYSTPLCTPSRVQLMTGKYNFRNYVGFGILDPEERTFGHMMQDAGYRTAIAGKWQLYGNRQQRQLFNRTGAKPAEAGFDAYYLWQIDERPPNRFKNPGLNLNSETVQHLDGAFGPDVFADSLIGFMAQNKDRPFFAYYPMVLTHDPFQPTPGHPDYPAFNPADSNLNDAAYFADNVAYMDKIVGRLVEALDDQGIREQTLVLFIGDNGTDRDVTSAYGDRQIRGDKGNPTKYGTHVPMIANWSGTIAEGAVNNNLIDFTDFLPTLADLAGVALPEGDTLDGLSFHKQLVAQADSVRSWVFCHYAPQWGRFEHVRYVHNHTWKLYEDGRVFNMMKDPRERRPVPRENLDANEVQLMQSFEEVLAQMQ